MTAVMGPKRGDLEPPLVLDTGDGNSTADLTTATSWKIFARRRGDLTGTKIIDHVVDPGDVVVDPANKYKAVVTYRWTAPDTAIAGLLDFEIKAYFATSRPETFPTGGYIAVMIDDDLG